MANNILEDGLQKLNRATMQTPEEIISENNRVLSQVLQDILNHLKKDPLFDALYVELFYAGSFYDGLKIKNPDEYDIDILLNVTRLANVILISKSPGYAAIQLKKTHDLRIRKFLFIKDCQFYISAETVNRWFEGLIQKALNKITSNLYQITCFSKSGPAKTLRVTYNNYYFDVDLVPCMSFHQRFWPSQCKRYNESLGFLLVPKPIYNEGYWRISFPFQERMMLLNKGFLKSAIRLIKLMRDQECQKLIKSYYIKSVSFHELEKYPKKYIRQSLSYTFIKMLQSFQSYIENGILPFFWDEELNLMQDCKKGHLINFSFRLKKLIFGLESICLSRETWQFFKMPVIFEAVTGKFGFVEIGPDYFQTHEMEFLLEESLQNTAIHPANPIIKESQLFNLKYLIIFVIGIIVFFCIQLSSN